MNSNSLIKDNTFLRDSNYCGADSRAGNIDPKLLCPQVCFRWGFQSAAITPVLVARSTQAIVARIEKEVRGG
jgi:hypothetical protein